MSFSRKPYRFEVAAIGVVCALAIGAPASAATTTRTITDPSVRVTAAPVAPGSVVTARLDGWPAGPATVGVCGDDARRGSEDCALVGDVAVAVRKSGTTLVDLTVVAPPVACPCVVRATQSSNDVVRTAPITLLGVASGPLLAADPANAAAVDVHSEIQSGSSWVQSLSRSFAGPARKSLVITLHNRGRTPVTNLRVIAEVGRSSSSGAPLTVQTVAAVEPGTDVTLRVPVSLPAPAYGEYRVTGTVYGLATPAPFDTATSNDPWALELAAPIVLLGLAQYLRRRERAGGNWSGSHALEPISA